MEGSGRFTKRSKLPALADLVRRKGIKDSDHLHGKGEKGTSGVPPRHDPTVQQTSGNRVKSTGCVSVVLQNLSLAYGNEDDLSDSSSDESSPGLSTSNQDSDQQSLSQSTTTVAVEFQRSGSDSASARESQGSELVLDESRLIPGKVEELEQHQEDSASPAALSGFLEHASSQGNQQVAQEQERGENSWNTDKGVISPGAVAELAVANQDNSPHRSKGVTEGVSWSQRTDASSAENGHYRETSCSELQAHPVSSEHEESTASVAPQPVESSVACPASDQPTETAEGLAQIEDVGTEQGPAIPAVDQEQARTNYEEVPVKGVQESQPVHSHINREQFTEVIDECVDHQSTLTFQQTSSQHGTEETQMVSLETDTNFVHSGSLETEHHQYDVYSHDSDGHCQQEDGSQYSVVGQAHPDSKYEENSQFQEYHTDTSQSLADSQELQTQSYTDDSQLQAYSQELQTQSYTDDSQSQAYSQELQTQSYTDDSQLQAYSQELQTQSYTDDSQSQAYSQELQTQSYTDDSQSQAYSQELQTQSYTDDLQSQTHSKELQTQSYTSDSQSQAHSQELQTQSYTDDSQSQAYSQELQTQSYTDDSQSQAYSQELQTQSYIDDSQSQGYSQELQTQSYTDDSQSQGYSYDPQTQSYYQGSQPQTQTQSYSEDLQSQTYTQTQPNTEISQSQVYSHDPHTETYSHGPQTAAYSQHSPQSQVYSHNAQPRPHSQDPQSLAYSQTQIDSQSQTTYGPPAQDDQLYTETEAHSHTQVHPQLQASSQTQSYSQVQGYSQSQTYSQDQQTQANSQVPVHSQDPQAYAHFQDSHTQANSQPQDYSHHPQAQFHSSQDPQSHAHIQSQGHSYNPQVHDEYTHDSKAQSYSQDQVFPQSQPYSQDPQYEAQYDQQTAHGHSSHSEGGYAQQGSYAPGSQDYYSDTGDPNYHPHEGQQHSTDYSEQGPGASHAQQNWDHSQPQYGAHFEHQNSRDGADLSRGFHGGQEYPSHDSLPPSNHPGYEHCEEPHYYSNAPPRSWGQLPEPHSEHMGAQRDRWQRGYSNPPPPPPQPPPPRYLHSPSQNEPPGHYTRDFRRDSGNLPPQQSHGFRDPNYRDSPSWGGRYGQHPSYQRDSRPSRAQQYTNPPYHSPSPSSSRSTASPSTGIQSPVAESPSQQEHSYTSSLEKGQASLNSPQRSSQSLETASTIPLQDPRQRSHDPEGKQHYLKSAKYSGLGSTSLRKRTPMLKYGNPKRKEVKSKGPQIIAPHHSTASEEPSSKSSSKVVVKGKDSGTSGRVQEGASSSWEGPKPLTGFKIPKLKGTADKASKGKPHPKVSQEEKPPVKKEMKEQQSRRPVTIVPKTVTVVPKTVTIVPKTHTSTKPSKTKAATKTAERAKKALKVKNDSMASLLSSIDPATLQVLASSIQQALSKTSSSTSSVPKQVPEELSPSAEASTGEQTARSFLQVKDEVTVSSDRNHSEAQSDDADVTTSSLSTNIPSTDLSSMTKRDETAAASIGKDTAVQTMLQRVTKPTSSVKEGVATRQSAARVDGDVKSRKPATVVATILPPKNAEQVLQTSSSRPAPLKDTQEKEIVAAPMDLESESSPPSSLPVVIQMSPSRRDTPREGDSAAKCEAGDGSNKISVKDDVPLQSGHTDQHGTDRVDTHSKSPVEDSPSAKSSEKVMTSAICKSEEPGCEKEQNEASTDEGTEVEKSAQSQSDFSFEFFNSKFLYKEYNLRRTRKRTDTAAPQSKKRKTVPSDAEHSTSKVASKETASRGCDMPGSEISAKKRERSPDTDDELPEAKRSMDSTSAEKSKSPSPVTRIVSVDLTRIAPTISRKAASKKGNANEDDSDATENIQQHSTDTPTLRPTADDLKTKKPRDKDELKTKVSKNENKASRKVQSLSVFDFVDDDNTTHPVLPSAQASPQKATSKGIKPSTKELKTQPDKKRLLKKVVTCALCKLKGNASDLGFLFGPYRYTPDQSATAEGTSKSGDEAKPAKTLVSSELWVHEDCAVWAPGVCLVGRQLKGLLEAASDGEKMVCSSCKKSGATLCCMRSSRGCKMVYHYPCAKDAGCFLSQEQFLIACPKHKEGK